jgi:antitoxin (DNA-binding transcriptional repressor) of toxin-antitoxin stability system
MYHMKTVSIRDLRYHFPKVERLLQHGETVQITKRKRVVGTLSPPEPPAKPPMPDFMARMKKIWKKPHRVTGAELISRDRDHRF